MNKITNILIVDDDDDDIILFRNALLQICPDVQLHTANDVLQMVELLNGVCRPDIIILDVNMPGKNGKQGLEEARAMKAYDQVIIVMLTTSNNPADIEQCRAKGANGYFVKPGTFDELKTIVSNICNGQLHFHGDDITK